ELGGFDVGQLSRDPHVRPLAPATRVSRYSAWKNAPPLTRVVPRQETNALSCRPYLLGQEAAFAVTTLLSAFGRAWHWSFRNSFNPDSTNCIPMDATTSPMKRVTMAWPAAPPGTIPDSVVSLHGRAVARELNVRL